MLRAVGLSFESWIDARVRKLSDVHLVLLGTLSNVPVSSSALTNVGNLLLGKGGAFTMSSRDDDEWDSTGGKAILINSTFAWCHTEENGGVVYLNEYATLQVKGNLNR